MKDKFKRILFKQRKNRTFNYQSRFSEGNEGGSKDDEPAAKEFVSRWKDKRTNRKVGLGLSVRALILILVLLLICMLWLESKVD